MTDIAEEGSSVAMIAPPTSPVSSPNRAVGMREIAFFEIAGLLAMFQDG